MNENNYQIIPWESAVAECCSFTPAKGDREHHILLHIRERGLTASQELEQLAEAGNVLFANHFPQAKPVFKRYLVSDAANQRSLIGEWETAHCGCACGIIQQAPLDGTKTALWIYAVDHTDSHPTPDGLWCARRGAYRHLWNGGAREEGANSQEQTKALLERYVKQLESEKCRLADNCVRTWFFVHDIDNHYAGVVRARNEVFDTQGLTTATHFIASTGIGGRTDDHRLLVTLDNYAVAGLQPGQMNYLYAADHLNRTSDYGVSFERGTTVDYGDRRHVFISGTASIDHLGRIVHPGDIRRQTWRMWENVEALLAEAGCTFDEVGHMLVYLRDPADYFVVSKMFAERFPHTPKVFLEAPVCRPGWLIEMECMAVKSIHRPEFPDF